MTARPCIRCGDLTPTGTYCTDCKPPDTKSRARGHVHTNTATWKRLSQTARQNQPWCTRCNSTDDLCTDHVIPYSIAPELGLVVENCQVLCRPCNGRRGNTFTQDDAQQVLTRLQATYKRRPTRLGRERVNVAQRVTDQAGRGQRAAVPPVGKAQHALHIDGSAEVVVRGHAGSLS